MLILTRRPGESLYLGENIRITVLGMQGKQVRLGLEVPEETTVYREEVGLWKKTVAPLQPVTTTLWWLLNYGTEQRSNHRYAPWAAEHRYG